MKATVKNLQSMNYGSLIYVKNEPSDSYTKIATGIYRGMFESHLYAGDIYTVEMLAEQMQNAECVVERSAVCIQ